jgi:hypothetical protein
MQSPIDDRSAAEGESRPGSPVQAPPGGSLGRRRPVWRVADIDFTRADRLHRDDETLFYLLTGASFVESGSELYTRNLLTYYRDDARIAEWLGNVWEPEELQHGAALRAYVKAVWPEFDWADAYGRFLGEYSRAASPEAFEATPRLELAARCMIETGTTSLYRMLHAYAREPVLRAVLAHIRDDEVNHFKHFLGFFRSQPGRENRLRVAWAIGRRVRESRSGDAWIAFRHAFEVRNPGRSCRRADFDRWQAELRGIIRRAFPFRLAADMLLAPLALPALFRGLARLATEAGLRRALCG